MEIKDTIENVLLIGFMGSGKTTVGRLLSQKTGGRFIDLDGEIVRLDGRTIMKIFAQDGEEHFRNIETQVLFSLCNQQQSMVLATGGGIVGRPANWEAMRRLGRIIYLEVSWETLRQRLASSSERPLIKAENGWEDVRGLYEKRLSLYRQADFTVDGEQDSRQVAETILRLLSTSQRIGR